MSQRLGNGLGRVLVVAEFAGKELFVGGQIEVAMAGEVEKDGDRGVFVPRSLHDRAENGVGGLRRRDDALALRE